jgi:hemerythrin-like domain-containing protein
MNKNLSSGMSSGITSTSSSTTSTMKTDKEYASTTDISEYSLTPNQPIDNLIKMDHLVVRKIYDKFKNAINKEEAQEWRNQLVYEIACHSVAEEIVLYPVIRDQLPNGKELFNISMNEHKEVKDHLYKAQKLDAYTENFRVEVKLVMDALIKHIEKEENDILPLLDMNLTKDKRVELGNMFAKRKLIVPTRPHPDAPVEPTTVESLIGMLTAPLDKFKDFFTSFPEKEKISEIKKQAQEGQITGTTGTKQSTGL